MLALLPVRAGGGASATAVGGFGEPAAVVSSFGARDKHASEMDLGCGSYEEGIDWGSVQQRVKAFLSSPQREHSFLPELLRLARMHSKSDCYIGLTTLCYLGLLFMDTVRLSSTLRNTMFGGVHFQEQIPLAYWDTISSGWPIFGMLEMLANHVREAGIIAPSEDKCCDRFDSDRETQFLKTLLQHLSAGAVLPAKASLAYLAGAPSRCSWGKATAYFALSECLLLTRSAAALQAAKDMMVLGEQQLDSCAEDRNVTVGEQMLSRWPFWSFLRRIEQVGGITTQSQHLRVPPGYLAPPLPAAPRLPAPPRLPATAGVASASAGSDGGGHDGARTHAAHAVFFASGEGAHGGRGHEDSSSGPSSGRCDARDVHVALAGSRQHAEGVLAVLNSAMRGTSSPQRLCLHLFCLESEAEFYRSALRCSFANALRGEGSDFQVRGAALRLHAFDAKEVLTDGMAVDAGVLSEAGDLNAPHNYVRFRLATWIPPRIASKVVYLDTDVIVLGDVCELHDMSFPNRTLSGHGPRAVVAAVPRKRLPLAFYLKALSPKMPVWLPSTAPSFNAGVVVFDMVAWQQLGITTLVAEWAYWNRARELWRGGSQPPLLLLLHDRVQWLDVAWNVDGLGHRRNFSEEDLLGAKILHWTGPLKPWLPGGLHKELWEPFGIHCWEARRERAG